MQLKIITAPAQEPLTLEEVKTHLRIHPDIDDEDALITSYIKAARTYCEGYQNRAYFTQTMKLLIDRLEDEIIIPRPPLQSVTQIQYQKNDGSLIEYDNSNYIVDNNGDYGIVYLAEEYDDLGSIDLAPVNAIQITFIAGYDETDDIPQTIKQAMLLLIGNWYENREQAIIGHQVNELPFAVKSLLNLDRVWSI